MYQVAKRSSVLPTARVAPLLSRPLPILASRFFALTNNTRLELPRKSSATHGVAHPERHSSEALGLCGDIVDLSELGSRSSRAIASMKPFMGC